MNNRRIKTRSCKVGVTPPHSCSYLPEQQQSLAVVLEPDLQSIEGYQVLIASGFRRSGDTLYRPQCATCSACHSLRVDTFQFTPTKSQKRQLNQLSKLTVRVEETLDPNWFALYERYIAERHQQGSMFPANKEDFLAFIQCHWQKTNYLHLFEGEKLIAVAVTDIIINGYSAIYSFFEPQHPWSLGSLCVLAQIQQAKNNNLPWLYLGFQIDKSPSMNYKKKFAPNQRYIDGAWINMKEGNDKSLTT